MARKTPIWASLSGLAILLTIVLAGCGLRSAFLPSPAPTRTLPTVRVTADQVAQAMADDHFYFDYGGNTLLIGGSVAAVSVQNGDSIVELATSVSTKVYCDAGHQPVAVRVGDTIAVESADPQNDVSRDGSDVLIKNCMIVSSNESSVSWDIILRS